VKARQARDFEVFSGPLGRMLDVVAEEADTMSHPEEGRYTALLDLRGEDFTATELEDLFGTLRQHLTKLVQAISRNQQAVDGGFLRQPWDDE